eukprot:5097121-Ditylum_brightwellii.AAC.1
MQVAENTVDRKKATTSDAGDKKMPAKCECKYDINNYFSKCTGHIMDEKLPAASKVDNAPLKKKTCATMKK